MTGPLPQARPAEPGSGAGSGPGPAPVKVRRLRARRTVAAVVVATAVLVLGVALLYDVISVRTGHPARRWRSEVADELAARHLDDLWVLVGAGAVTLAGGWLLWLAFAPGLRRWLPLRPHGDTSAAVDRGGVGTLLDDRAAGLPGIDRLRIRINRRRVKVVLDGPADPASVQRQLRAELARVPLARPLRLDVRTRRGRAGATAVPGDGAAAEPAGAAADARAGEKADAAAGEKAGAAPDGTPDGADGGAADGTSGGAAGGGEER
ncbi:DUF6286 domain-containing protein [Kitasatospora sp. NPDC047058]|uniref:DUF6286 domain-containing protein n=1 Tax=Kitasatospora sp. NPDC047058 TaxID=3155620 RepID=UPI0034104DE7